MEQQWLTQLKGREKEAWQQLMAACGLDQALEADTTVLIWDDEHLAAAGSRQGRVLKHLAVSPLYQGDGLTATVLTALRQEAFREGFDHLFLYTKPGNRSRFEPLFFYPVVQTPQVLLMENRRNGLKDFLAALPSQKAEGPVGALVMNCDPFTLGHRYLAETAARECQQVYLFVLSEDQSFFPAKARLEMVRRGVRDLSNVTVLPTGPYLISAATFPTYFLKDRDAAGEAFCQLDIRIFLEHFAPRLGITRRYVGSEPLSPLTDKYNQALEAFLPPAGIDLRQIPRLKAGDQWISASRVRGLYQEKDWEQLARLVPPTTYAYLTQQEVLE